MPAMIGLFPTCLGDAVHPQVVRDAARVLRAAGVEAAPIPGATCCGQPAWNSGFAADARRVARRTLHAMAGLEAVVVPSGSCTAMMRLHWRELFRGDRDQACAERVSGRVFELSQYLVNEIGWTPAAAPRERAQVGYHDSCHMLRELSLRDEPRVLLAAVADLREVPRSDRCCGFGGTFSVRYPDVSTAMADDRIATATAAGIGILASADPGCIMQIEGRAARTRAGLRVVHLATVVAEALA
jgi:L-lactate dehydrogenase complex protein LldE